MVLSYDMPFGMIKIHSNDITIINAIGSVVNPATYINKFANVEYNVFLKNSLTFKADDTYRAMQMKKGIYLGHNIGTNCELCIDERNIYLYVQNKEVYPKIFWSFVLKYIFTKVALDNGVLHAKGLLLKNVDGRLFVFFGKGNSGKTTLARKLRDYGCAVLSNTHCFIKKDYVWGVNTWIRERDERGVQSYKHNIDVQEEQILHGIVDQAFIVDYNKKNLYNCYELKFKHSYYYLKNFAAAISNYDLKEEVWDYFSSEFSERMEYLEKEDILVKEIIESNNLHYVSVDIKNEVSLNGFLDDFILKRGKKI